LEFVFGPGFMTACVAGVIYAPAAVSSP